MRSQPRLRGQIRLALPSSVHAKIRAAVERDALRWDCSRSWVVATALAAFYDIDILQPHEAQKRRTVPVRRTPRRARPRRIQRAER